MSQPLAKLASTSRLFAPRHNQYWLHNRDDGPRRAAIASIGIDGHCMHAVLEEAITKAGLRSTQAPPRTAPAVQHHEALFVIEGDRPADLAAKLKQLGKLASASDDMGAAALASRWHHTQGDQSQRAQAVTFLASSTGQLCKLIEATERGLDRQPEPWTVDRAWYTPDPLGPKGEVAFVFPGSGNQFDGMAAALGVQWPHVLRRQDMENGRHASQFADAKFWMSDSASRWRPRDIILGHVWLGAFVSDLLASFGVNPDAVIGYSLGETTSLFATRTWGPACRDQMLRRLTESTLFTDDLAGPCHAARAAWGLGSDEQVDWIVGVVDRSATQVRQALRDRFGRAYLLIVNTPEECVIGGDRGTVKALVKSLGCSFHEVEGVTTVHCEVAEQVQRRYHELHIFDTTPPDAVRFYSGTWGKAYRPDRQSAADSILGQALAPFDFTQVIHRAYEDGVRLFVETGPGASCTRMIGQILGDRPHRALSSCVAGKDAVTTMLGVMAQLISERVPVDRNAIDGDGATQTLSTTAPTISVSTGGQPFRMPPTPRHARPESAAKAAQTSRLVPQLLEPAPAPTVADLRIPMSELIQQATATQVATAHAEEAFLRLTKSNTESLGRALAWGSREVPVDATATRLALDRSQCLEFATGSIAQVLGPDFAPIDKHPTRVRLPDEPLMLVDRIIEVEGRLRSMTSGRVVTEHDIRPDAWYLDGGRMPTCIAVEAGQADLFLSGYLGVDFQTRGLAVYRLLDAAVTFHRSLPAAGQTIRYDIHIDRFSRQNQTILFHFHFEATIVSTGEALLSMRNGCAGFFSQAALAAGQGIVESVMEQKAAADMSPGGQPKLAPWDHPETYDDEQVDGLRRGDLAGCFGPHFARLDLDHPVRLPSGRMTLVHRVKSLDLQGGRYGLGQIVGEADIQPDDWFLTCHFVDDRVMPGTLMYECCLHTLRIFLLRMGWVGKADEVVFEPRPGVTSQLKCRGQVIASTKKVQYQLDVRELGYEAVTGGAAEGEPYVIADALMYADGRPIVQMKNMSLRLHGLTRHRVERLWSPAAAPNAASHSPVSPHRPALFDQQHIQAFAVGKPSAAFGDRYRCFDHDRFIARLPGPPYSFVDRIVSIEHCRPWELTSGAMIEAEYDVPPDAWYFASERQDQMPFAVLLEVPLQVCGWLAAYIGSALTSENDLRFRNLGGRGTRLMPVTRDVGTLVTSIHLSDVTKAGDMILQHFDFSVKCDRGEVYRGYTYFGFFSAGVLANQVGIRDTSPYQPTDAEQQRGRHFGYPDEPPFPEEQLRMIDQIDLFDPQGGPHGLGLILASAQVIPDRWFFRAHFYQDPVWPGSLGLESLLQLLKLAAHRRWGEFKRCLSMAENQEHHWLYRGQILPSAQHVKVEAVIKACDDGQRRLDADGLLSVDGRPIYRMSDFTLRILDP